MDPEALILAKAQYVSVARTVTATEPGGWLIIATPIFKASYSGLLKVFLDLLPQFALAGKAILPIATGGSVHHPARSRIPLQCAVEATTDDKHLGHPRPLRTA